MYIIVSRLVLCFRDV